MWLASNGTAYRPGKGQYQVMQVAMSSGIWACLYIKNAMPDFYLADKNLSTLIDQFHNDKLRQSYPNETTLQAMSELESGGGNRFADCDAMMNAIMNDHCEKVGM
ncbi:unnamed protein product [Brugia timori]|uniref:Lytic murein transglycosylase n=1 Tax=Brugia timori TaxID=42155 RepID=A0A0R3Q2Y7_9BILA|nr:unnamed protein product [Brugia timori]